MRAFQRAWRKSRLVNDQPGWRRVVARLPYDSWRNQAANRHGGWIRIEVEHLGGQCSKFLRSQACADRQSVQNSTVSSCHPHYDRACFRRLHESAGFLMCQGAAQQTAIRPGVTRCQVGQIVLRGPTVTPEEPRERLDSSDVMGQCLSILNPRYEVDESHLEPSTTRGQLSSAIVPARIPTGTVGRDLGMLSCPSLGKQMGAIRF